eukprot:9471058-Pyramimonas_sp.AAC.1
MSSRSSPMTSRHARPSANTFSNFTSSKNCLRQGLVICVGPFPSGGARALYVEAVRTGAHGKSSVVVDSHSSLPKTQASS